MKIILNSELAKMKSLETQFYDDAEHFICTLEDSCDFQDDVGEIMSIVENAGNIQDGYTITDTIRIGDTRYMHCSQTTCTHKVNTAICVGPNSSIA